ncbi:protein of unknown function (plasmid) [Cupriavidus taiwanensis]|uniref:Uncharacterized protein n=1 Tax=Cupriavidus taiwanensis TaxID=164546 RepID=A0A9Q7XRG3_9BURK|nr:protein of unknown function [Cupriavidus taiwanensis]
MSDNLNGDLPWYEVLLFSLKNDRFAG